MAKEPPFLDGPYLTADQAQRFYDSLSRAVVEGKARNAIDLRALNRILRLARLRRWCASAALGLALGVTLALIYLYA